MRRFAFLATGLLPLTTGAILACESETNSGPPTIAIDSETIDGATNPPTPPGDASPPTPANAVTVTVLSLGAPRSGVLVVFHDANGAVLESKSTGADGKASSTGATPAMASVLTERENQRSITTWTALEGGDELVLHASSGNASLGSYDIALTGPFAGAALYSGRVGFCESSGGWTGQASRNLPLNSSCAQAQNGVLVHALNGQGRTIAHAFSKGVALPGASPAPVTVGNFVAPTDVTVTATNTGGASVGLTLTEGLGPVAYRTAGTVDQQDSRTFPTTTGFADSLQAIASVSSQGGGARSIVRRIATPVAGNAIALDMANLLTSKVTDAIANMVDPRRPDISISFDTPLIGADGGYVRFYNGLADNKQLAWTFVVPPSTTTFKAPALPASADAWVAVPDAGGPSPSVEVVFGDTDALPDYKAFRRQPGTDINSGNVIPTLVNGTTRLTSFANGT